MAGKDWLGGATLAVAAGTALTAAVAMAVTGAVAPAAHLPRAAAAELPAFDSCQQLAGWYRDQALPDVTAYGLPWQQAWRYGAVAGTGSVPGAIPLASGRAAMPADAGSSGGASAGGLAAAASGGAEKSADAVTNGATGTNQQEAGVDEADLVKVDGGRVVGVSGNTLYVSAVGAGSLAPPVTVTLPLGQASELLVDGDRALVVGMQYAASGDGTMGGPAYDPAGPAAPVRVFPISGQPEVVLVTVSISAGSPPAVVGSEQIDGGYVSARLTGDTARVVLSSVDGPRMVAPASPGSESTALAANRTAIEQATAQDWLPSRTLRDARGTVTAKGPLIDCAAVRHPVDASGLGTLSVVTVRLDGDRPLADAQTVGISAAGDLVYESGDRLYVATARWQAAARTDGGSGGPVTTQIHAFDASRPGTTAYVASGTVDGYLYDRWAMDENDHLLRVAVTTGQPEGVAEPMPMPVEGDGVASGSASMTGPPGGQSQSSIVVLKEDGATLREVGRLDGLGPTEQIRAVRWLGDLAAVVTFRRTDPLYLVDLSDPAHPRTAGELKVDGYSAYLHPVGDGLLLGVGQNVDAYGEPSSAMVQLFDVSDPAHPVRLSGVTEGRGQLLAEQDARAFTYLADGLAVLPIQRWGAPGPSSGAVTVSVDAAAKTLAQGPQFTSGSGEQTMRVVPVGGQLVAVGTRSLTLLDDHLRQVARVDLPGVH